MKHNLVRVGLLALLALAVLQGVMTGLDVGKGRKDEASADQSHASSPNPRSP